MLYLFSQVVQVVLDGINNLLKMADSDMEAITAMIEECGGLDKIESLQNHENVEIYKLAYEIIEQYFSEEGDDDPNLAPQLQADGNFQFQPGADPGAPGGGAAGAAGAGGEAGAGGAKPFEF